MKKSWMMVAAAMGLVSSEALAQIDFGRYQIKQNNIVVGELVVTEGGQNTKMENYYLFTKTTASTGKFNPPSQSNPNSAMQFVYLEAAPGLEFDPFMYQLQLPAANQFIQATCVDFGEAGK